MNESQTVEKRVAELLRQVTYQLTADPDLADTTPEKFATVAMVTEVPETSDTVFGYHFAKMTLPPQYQWLVKPLVRVLADAANVPATIYPDDPASLRVFQAAGEPFGDKQMLERIAALDARKLAGILEKEPQVKTVLLSGTTLHR